MFRFTRPVAFTLLIVLAALPAAAAGCAWTCAPGAVQTGERAHHHQRHHEGGSAVTAGEAAPAAVDAPASRGAEAALATESDPGFSRGCAHARVDVDAVAPAPYKMLSPAVSPTPVPVRAGSTPVAAGMASMGSGGPCPPRAGAAPLPLRI